MMRILKEPMLHFLVLGALLFSINHYIESSRPQTEKIVVTRGKIENLAATFVRARQRPPSEQELEGLLQDYIRDEVYAREAVAMGLDQDDTIIRRRLRQKMEFVANDLAEQAQPTDSQLQEHLTEHIDKYRTDSITSFRQVYISIDRRGQSAQQHVDQLLQQLNADPGADFRELSDTTLLEPEIADARTTDVIALYGSEFEQHLQKQPIGSWQGPFTSTYGMHLIFVVDRNPGRTPRLEEIRDVVARDWSENHRSETNERFYEGLLQRYTVVIEPPSQNVSSAE